MTPEQKVQQPIIKYFKSLQQLGLPVFIERRQAGGFNYKKGIPDLYVVYDGQHLEIEVKGPGGHQSTMQEKFEAKCKKLNIKYVCASSVDEVKEKMLEWFNLTI